MKIEEGEKEKRGKGKEKVFFLLRHKRQSLSKKRFYMSKHNTNRLHAAMTIINHSPLSNTHTHTQQKVAHGPLYNIIYIYIYFKHPHFPFSNIISLNLTIKKRKKERRREEKKKH